VYGDFGVLRGDGGFSRGLGATYWAQSFNGWSRSSTTECAVFEPELKAHHREYAPVLHTVVDGEIFAAMGEAHDESRFSVHPWLEIRSEDGSLVTTR
jgi:hypothetical protein